MVHIQSLSLRRLFPGSPCVAFRVECSKGTYIRTLAHELGQHLGTHAHLVELRREAVGEGDGGAGGRGGAVGGG